MVKKLSIVILLGVFNFEAFSINSALAADMTILLPDYTTKKQKKQKKNKNVTLAQTTPTTLVINGSTLYCPKGVNKSFSACN